MHKILTAAVREFRVTALTWAFLIGAVIAPALIWVGIIALSASGVLAQERDPLVGTIAVVDATEGQAATAGIERTFDPEYQALLRQRFLEQAAESMEDNPLAQSVTPAQMEMATAMAARFLGTAEDTDVDVESLGVSITPEQIEEQKQRVLDGELLALIIIDETSIEIPIDRVAQDTIDAAKEAGGQADSSTDDGVADEEDGDEDQRGLGEYELYHSFSLDPAYLRQIKNAVHRAVQDERYLQRGIPTEVVQLIAAYQPRVNATVVSADGQEVDANAGLLQMLPLIFIGLLFGAVMTGGQYLLMGTLEEKQSRVMEVLLSAVSPHQLLIGKMIGQMCVGLTILVIYSSVGLLAADRFGYLALVPTEILPLVLMYFLIAYLYMGTLMVSIGAAVTELREAQALYPPITFSFIVLIIPFIAIMENPASVIARIFSYFPPTTPFVMVMRISQPAYPVPWWEVAATLIVGFAFGGFMVFVAARIFRVGVLQFGKAPSLLGLIKWARAATR